MPRPAKVACFRIKDLDSVFHVPSQVGVRKLLKDPNVLVKRMRIKLMEKVKIYLVPVP